MRTYHGLPGGIVRVNHDLGGYELPSRLDLANHSPTGFAWGYAGSGPAQLALALLCDYFSNEGDLTREQAETQAFEWYQRFKFQVVAGLPVGQPWQIATPDIEQALAEMSAHL